MKAARFFVVLLVGCMALSASAGLARAQKPEPDQADIAAAKKHFTAARAHQNAGRFEEAAKEYLAAYELFPDAEFLFNVGEVYRLEGDKQRAVEYFEKYLKLDPNGRGSADARASVEALKKEIAAEEAASVEASHATGSAGASTEETGSTADSTAGGAGAGAGGADAGAGGTGAGAGGTDAGAGGADADADTSYPREVVLRPLQLSRGGLEITADVRAFTGLDTNWDAAVASWIGLEPAARYGVTDRIQVSGRALLLPVRPYVGDFEEAALFGAIAVGGQYLLNDLVSGLLEAGLGVRGRLVSNPYSTPFYPDPLYSSYTFAIRAGFAVKKVLGKRVAVRLEPSVVVQMDSTKDEESGCAEDDAACVTVATALHLPLVVHIQATPTLAVGVRTGIYTGSEWQLDPEEGATFPLLAEGMLTLSEGKLDLGLQLGFANLSPSGLEPEEDHDLGDTLYAGLQLAWRTL